MMRLAGKLMIIFLLGGLFWWTVYELFLYDLHNDYKIERIEQRMIDNYWANEAQFEDVQEYVQDLAQAGIIMLEDTTSPPGNLKNRDFSQIDFSVILPPPDHHSMRPQGPIYFNMGGPPAHRLDSLIQAVNCRDIDSYFSAGLRLTYLGDELLGFHYLLVEEGVPWPEDQWIRIKEGVYCGLYQDGLICTRGDWRWE